MKNRLEHYWRTLQKKLPEEQTFYLFIMMIFTGFRRECCEITNSEKFTHNCFHTTVRNIRTYDTKEAAFRLGEKIDWILPETDEELKEAIQGAYEEICSLLLSSRTEYLPLLLDTVLEFAGTTGGYITTPKSIRHLVEELFGGIDPDNAADFCCGISVFGADLCRDMCRKRKRELSSLSFYGAEKDSTLCAIGTLVMEMYGIHGRIEQKDILIPPEESEAPLYDLIVLDMPRGMNQREVYDVRDPRLTGFNGKTIYADWILIQDALYHLKDGGYAAVLCTTGALIRANEKSLREQIIRQDWLEAVFTLPANLYPNTRTGTELLIFHKGKKGRLQGQILFADISQFYFREKRNAYALSDEGYRAACDCYRTFVYAGRERGGNKNLSAVLQGDALDKQTCSWKPIQYIYQESETEEGGRVCLSDIADIIRGVQIVKKDVQDTDETAYSSAYFLNIKDIQERIVRYETAERISRSNSACKDKFRIREDDILLTSKGTAIKLAIVGPDPPPAFISGNITLLRVRKPAYDPYVLFHYLDSEAGRASLEQIQSGTTIRILNNTNLMALKVPQYGLERMRKIGSQLKEKREDFLKKQRALIEDYDTERKRLLDLLKEER